MSVRLDIATADRVYSLEADSAEEARKICNLIREHLEKIAEKEASYKQKIAPSTVGSSGQSSFSPLTSPGSAGAFHLLHLRFTLTSHASRLCWRLRSFASIFRRIRH